MIEGQVNILPTFHYFTFHLFRYIIQFPAVYLRYDRKMYIQFSLFSQKEFYLIYIFYYIISKILTAIILLEVNQRIKNVFQKFDKAPHLLHGVIDFPLMIFSYDCFNWQHNFSKNELFNILFQISFLLFHEVNKTLKHNSKSWFFSS